MRRRTCLVGATLAVCALSAGLVIDSVAGAKTVGRKPVTFTVTCNTNVTTIIPEDQTELVPAAVQGTDYGSVACGGARLPAGVQWDTWTVPDSGDTVGTLRQYFTAGTIHGTFDLTPGEAPPPTQASLGAETYTGTIKVDRGSGIYWGITGSGTEVCATPDGIHLSCTAKLKLKLPAGTRK